MNLADRLPKIFVCLLLLAAITWGVFQYTVHIRKPWFGAQSPEHHQDITADIVKFSQYWYQESPFRLKFGMFQNPASVEFQTLDSRKPYVSYPPGMVIPIYLISRIQGHEPTVEMVMSYSLANHYFLSLFLSWIAFFFCVFSGLPLLTSSIFSVIPVLISQLMPLMLFYYQSVFCPDQAVIQMIALFILLELLRDNLAGAKKSKWILFLQILLFISGVMTDWFFVIFAMVVYMKRLVGGEYAGHCKDFFFSSFKFWAPAILVGVLFLLQVASFQQIPLLIQRYQERSGHGVDAPVSSLSFLTSFLNGHLTNGFGFLAAWLIPAMFLMFVLLFILIIAMHFLKKNLPPVLPVAVSLAALSLVSSLIQVCWFKNHSAIHNFSALKFVIPLALIPCVVLPAAGWSIFCNKPAVKVHSAWVALVFLIIASTYTFIVHPGYRAYFYENNPIYKKLGSFVGRNTDYQDVVFSTKGSIGENPFYLSYSKKRVYLIQNAHQIYLFVQPLKGPYTINILTTAEPETDPGIRKLMSMAFDVRRDGGLALYKIRGQ